ncbi:MAG TPA: crosslink repair DNA glycosylase YcaQ family protein [Candidatus Limnocylindrales bacterium]|nr:crosslink repair DNA glycosylase YcaQ family protein [Candidatus Limnocylindrales bacterium]
MTKAPLKVDRDQILAFRRRVQALDERLPMSARSLRVAAWAGIQDSMPRAAVLAIHARVAGTEPETWADPALAQIWGPRFSAFVVPAQDVPIFTVGRYPDDARGRRVAEDMAAKVADHLQGRRLTDRAISAATGLGNGMRYGTTTGTLRIRWEGARAPLVWTVPRPEISPLDARIELARRFLHVFGPSKEAAFAHWAGVGAAQGREAFDRLAGDRGGLVAVRTPIGDGWLLATDEVDMRAKPGPTAPARFLPSGDPFYMFWGADRELLVPDATRRAELWTSRVWPGALLVDGQISGVWRRAGPDVTIDPWRRMTASERLAVESDAATMPLPGLKRPIRVRWPD